MGDANVTVRNKPAYIGLETADLYGKRADNWSVETESDSICPEDDQVQLNDARSRTPPPFNPPQPSRLTLQDVASRTPPLFVPPARTKTQPQKPQLRSVLSEMFSNDDFCDLPEPTEEDRKIIVRGNARIQEAEEVYNIVLQSREQEDTMSKTPLNPVSECEKQL